MIRCRQVARLVSAGELSESALRTRVAVRLHLMMCRHCRRFVRQLSWLGDAARALVRGFERDEAVHDLEARLLRRFGIG
jgi:hypothetical protein